MLSALRSYVAEQESMSPQTISELCSHESSTHLSAIRGFFYWKVLFCVQHLSVQNSEVVHNLGALIVLHLWE